MPLTLAHPARIAPRRVGVVSFLRAAHAAWRQRRALEQLDANARRDLGLSESDISREARRPAWDVPQGWLI